MKFLLTIFLILPAFSIFAQNSPTVDLKWKIAKGEKLNYSTVMNDIDTSDIEMNFDVLFEALADSTKNGLKESKSLLKKLNQAFSNQDFVSSLSNAGNGVIEVVVMTKPTKEKKDTSESGEAAMQKLMQSVNKGIMLRGSVYESGGVHSFWVKSAQKNLIAIFFELPKTAVKIGDKWALDISLIANDQNFDCDSSYKINEVTLIDLKKDKGETIAVLKYNIVEYVKGEFNSPFGNNGRGQTETMMKLSHQAVAEFSVEKGRWVSYDGIMSLEASGIITADKKTKLTLVNTSR